MFLVILSMTDIHKCSLVAIEGMPFGNKRTTIGTDLYVECRPFSQLLYHILNNVMVRCVKKYTN